MNFFFFKSGACHYIILKSKNLNSIHSRHGNKSSGGPYIGHRRRGRKVRHIHSEGSITLSRLPPTTRCTYGARCSKVTEILGRKGQRDLVRCPTDEAGTTLLHVAAFGDHSHIVQLLLTRGADHQVNAQNDDGLTPLHVAAMAGSLECLRLLLSHGADRNMRTLEGQLPVELAIDGSHSLCVNELLPSRDLQLTPQSNGEDSLYTTAIDLSSLSLTGQP